MNIVDQVGPSYFSARFAGSIFMTEEKKPAIISTVGSHGRVLCKQLESPKRHSNIEVPKEFFVSFKFLSLPKLGWRSQDRGRILVRLSRTNTSYTRGITTSNISSVLAPHTRDLINMGKYKPEFLARGSTLLAWMAAMPEHMSMRHGLELMNSGRILSFTNSADVAVVAESDEVYNIIFKEAHVANISPDGSITPVGDQPFDTEILK